MENVNGRVELANLIPAIWSSKFYETLKQSLMLGDVFSRDYEGEILKKGDRVKINTISVGAAETLTNDKTKFGTQEIVVGQKELVINRRTVHATKITDLASLQSQEFMESLKVEVMYQIGLKMENEILAYYLANVPNANVLNPIAALDFDTKDISKARTRAAKAKLPSVGKYLLLDPNYYGNLFNKNQMTSIDFQNGKAFTEQTLPNVAGFQLAEHNGFADNNGIFFHKSCLQLATQKGVSMEILSNKVNGEFSHSLVVDLVWDMVVTDTARMFRFKEV